MGRAWIVANGPSLRETPLHLLRDEVTFALNGIKLIYDKTPWRPSMYYMVDWSGFVPEEEWRENIRVHREMGIPMYLLADLKDGYPPNHPGHDELPSGVGSIPNVTWIERCKRHAFYSAGNSKSLQEWHLPTICTALNHVSPMMQILVTMGYDEIYLLGCDLGYQKDKTKNHFDPHYNLWDKRDMADQMNRNALQAHEVAKRSSPVPIYNCTVGGYLEVYPRRKLEDVLAGKYDA